MEDNQISSCNGAYRSLTNTILNDFNLFKNGSIEDVSLNEKMLINVFSMIKILQQKENDENNEDGYDEYVPGYKLDLETNNNNNNNNSNNNQNNSHNGIKLDNNCTKLYEESFMKKLEEFEPTYIVVDSDIPFTENESKIVNINHDNVGMSLAPNSIFGDISYCPNNDIYSSPCQPKQNNKSISISKKTTLEESHEKKEMMTQMMFSPKKKEGNISYNSDHNHISSVSIALRSTLDISEVKLVNKSISYLPKVPPSIKEKPIIINEFKPIVLNDKIKQFYLLNMNENYLIYMNNLFNKMKDESNSVLPFFDESNQFFFITAFKKYILSTGISYKKFYEDCLRHLIYQKENFTLENFLNCFIQLLKYIQKDGIVKYKCK